MHATVLGAAGLVGRLAVEELARRGHRASVPEVQPADGAGILRELARDRPDVVVAAAPSRAVAAGVVPAAVEAGVPVVDASFEQVHLRRIRQGWHERAAGAGVTVVPAAGWAFLLGDLLGAVAAGAAPGTTEVHVAYALPRRADLLGAWSRGARRAMVASLAAGGVGLHDGALVEEAPGEMRRLAWFPRPVGPHHAVGIPGTEALNLPRHVAGLRTVRTYAAVPSLAAEVLQAGAGSLRRSGGAGRLGGLLDRLPSPDGARREGVRWGCVAEAPAPGGGTARAWAYGTDPYAFAASALVLAAERVAGGAAGGGVLAPGELGDPADLLDELTLRSDARWSLARP